MQKVMRTKIAQGIVAFLIFAVIFGFAMNVKAEEGFKYENDPTQNCKVMQSIKVDPRAVYGFWPTPDGDLKQYADFDWSDKELIEKSRQDRINYFNQYGSMYDKAEEMLAEGKDIEEIARTVSAMRNQIRLDAYKDNPEGLEAAKKRNLEKYGNENGPTADSLFGQYGSWEMVFIKAFSENPAMDAALGLYDDRFEYYEMFGNNAAHSPVEDKGYAPTYEKPGLTDGSHCSVCGMILEEQKEIPKLESDVPKTGDEGAKRIILMAGLCVMVLGFAIYMKQKSADK